MNAIYKVAFNKITQSFVAVSELAKSGGKKSNKVNKSKVITSAVVTSGLLLSGATFAANPVNDTYVKVSEACDGNVAGECDLKNNDPEQWVMMFKFSTVLSWEQVLVDNMLIILLV